LTGAASPLRIRQHVAVSGTVVLGLEPSKSPDRKSTADMEQDIMGRNQTFSVRWQDWRFGALVKARNNHEIRISQSVF